MGNAQSDEPETLQDDDVPEAFGVRVSSRLLESLQAADQSPETVVTMTGFERRQLIEAAYQEGANAVHARLVEIFRDEQQKQHAEQTALQDRVERPALEAVEAQVKGLQEREYRAPTRDVPCADERGACLRCYAQNAQAPLDCADKVAALDRCAQAVSRVHLQTAAASQ
mmetsp:Transcript_19660/g.61175  ORF Transcript_19660/g.61175 Transcript_19660/m.61175 type:complete len:169 (-) Transcript_19660:302-808(-)